MERSRKLECVFDFVRVCERGWLRSRHLQDHRQKSQARKRLDDTITANTVLYLITLALEILDSGQGPDKLLW